MNFGLGLSSFARGLNEGIDAGTKIGGLINQGKVNRVRDQAVKDAEGQRESAIQNLIKTGSAVSADNSSTVPTYSVGDQQFPDQASARAAAETKAPSADDFYVRTVVPKIADAYMKQGNVQAAEQWNNWAQQKSTQTGMKHWTKALQAGQIGDFKAYADNMVKAYNAPGYYDDGLEADGYDLVKDKDGNTTGMTLKLRNKSTGEKFSQTVRGQEDMVKMGIGLLDPANAFKTTQAAVAAAQAARAKAAEGDLKFKRDVYRDGIKVKAQGEQQDRRDNAAMDRLVTGKQIDQAGKTAAVEAKANALRKAGYSDEFVKQAMPQLLGLGDYKKAAPPEEVRRMLHQEHLKDFNYTRKTPEEQAAIIDKDVQLINGTGASARNPMSKGLLPESEVAPKAGASGAPMIYDRQTGKMVPYR